MESNIIGRREIVVTDELTAAAVDASLPSVFSTPQLISLIEMTAAKSVESMLEPGQTTVGTEINIKHMAATPVGMKISCETVLREREKNRLEFDVRAYDDKELVAEGTHQRFIIKKEKFMLRAAQKASPDCV